MERSLAPARIGILADTSLQRHLLQSTLSEHGYQVVFNHDPKRVEFCSLTECEASVWLIDLAQVDECDLVEQLLSWTQVPVLFGDGNAPERSSEHYPRWQRRLLSKLLKLFGAPVLEPPASAEPPCLAPDVLAALAEHEGEPAQHVWLLAASLGGPAAVKAFLDALPGALPVGFLYAQHIDPRFENVLPKAVGRHSQWKIGHARDGDWLRCGEVVVVPVSSELRFDAQGLMQLTTSPWPQPYSPSIERMMRNVAGHFGEYCGVIVFSGMGEDGSAAAAYVREQGGQLWSQSAESCACASMPQSMQDTGWVQLSADPQALATQVMNHLAAHCVLR